MLKKPEFKDAVCKIFAGGLELERTTDKQLQKEAEKLVRTLVSRELRAAKTKQPRLMNIASIIGQKTLNSVIDGLSQRDASACLKRSDPGAPELIDGKQTDMVGRLKEVAAGADLNPPPTKVTSAKTKAKKSESRVPTFESLSLDGRRKR